MVPAVLGSKHAFVYKHSLGGGHGVLSAFTFKRVVIVNKLLSSVKREAEKPGQLALPCALACVQRLKIRVDLGARSHRRGHGNRLQVFTFSARRFHAHNLCDKRVVIVG